MRINEPGSAPAHRRKPRVVRDSGVANNTPVRRVNRTPPRKTVPIRAVGIKGVVQQRPAPRYHAPVTDVQSSGGDYGSRKANRYKRTADFKRILAAAKPQRMTDATSSARSPGGGYGERYATAFHNFAAQNALRANAGHPFDPAGVRAAITLGLREAHDLTVGRDGRIERKMHRSLFGINALVPDVKTPLDPRKGGVHLELYAQKAGLDAAGMSLLNQTARLGHAVAGGLTHGPHGFTEGLLHNKPYTFGKALKSVGVPGVVAGPVGFVADVASDPTTYVTFGTGSLARRAATEAAAKVGARFETQAVLEGESAMRHAVRAGASQQSAEAAAERAAANVRREGAVQARKAGERVLEQHSASRGLTVAFGKHEVPGVTRATAKAGRGVQRATSKLPERVRTGAKGTQGVARDFRPQMRPAGTSQEQFLAIRHAGREARASTQLGISEATQKARGLLDRLSKEEYGQVIDAIERGSIRRLPAHLHPVAAFLRDEFRHAKRLRRQAGIPEGTIRNYFPHVRSDQIDEPGALEHVQTPPKGPRTVGSHRREIKKTISVINAEQAAKGKADLFSTDVPLVYAHSMTGTARDVARATMFRRIADSGDEIKPRLIDGKREWPVRDLRPGEAIYHIGPHDGRYGLREIKPEQIGKKGGPARAGKYVILDRRLVEQQLSGITTAERSSTGAAIDHLTSGFKRIATFTPGFHVRNLVGDTQMAYLSQPGHRLPANVVQARRALNRLTDVEKGHRADLGRVEPTSNTIPIGGRPVPMDDFLNGARKHGVIRSGYIGRELEELRGIGKVRVGHGFGEKVKRIMQNREDLMRLATYKHGLDSGLTHAHAADLSLNTHIDYGDLTRVERKYARRAAPFYTFSARALPIHAKTLVTKPGKYATFEKAREEAATATGLDLGDEEKKLRVFQKRQMPFIMKIGGKTIVLSDSLPLTLLNEVPASANLPAYIDELSQWIGGLANPILKDPVELYSNRSFFFRSDIQNPTRPLVSAPSWVAALYKSNRPLAEKLGIVPDYYDRKTGKHTWGWYGKSDYIAKSIPGLPNLLQQLTSPGANRRGQTGVEKALGGVLGVKAEPLDPAAALTEALFKRLDEVSKRVGAFNQRGIKAGNATPEYSRLTAEQAKIKATLNRLSLQSGDKVGLFNSSQKRAPSSSSTSPVDEGRQLLHGAGGVSPGAVDDGLRLLRAGG